MISLIGATATATALGSYDASQQVQVRSVHVRREEEGRSGRSAAGTAGQKSANSLAHFSVLEMRSVSSS